MGQKVHPIGIRLGIVKKHSSNWFAKGNRFAENVVQDFEVREFLREELEKASISLIEIERQSDDKIRIVVHSARPGVAIGPKGSHLEKHRAKLEKMTGLSVELSIEEIRKPELDAKLVAENIAQQLERRVMFRRAMKRAVQNTMRAGSEGIKVMVGGRLGGTDIARSEWTREGRVPLHTLRANIDYATADAATTYGIIGVKVWIFKGEVIGDTSPEK